MRTCISNANAAGKQAFGLTLAAALFVSGTLAAQASEPILYVEKTATCGCCHAWVERMRDAGFDVRARDVSQDALIQMKIALGISPDMASCHTASIDGYAVEGHVPAQDIRRLLSEAPRARGLSAPGMPLGSPGMDMDDAHEPYDVILIHDDGGLSTFSHYE